MVYKDKDYSKKYYQKNKDKILVQRKEHYQNNKDKIIVRSKKYYQKNKEEIKKNSQIPEVKKRIKEYHKRWWQKNKEELGRKRKKYCQEHKDYYKEYDKKYRQENKEKVKEYKKEHYQKPEVKKRINQYEKNRKKTDKNFKIICRLRNRLWCAFKNYTKTGKIFSSSKYGIDYQAIIEYLKPFPEDISKYEIDHRKPLCSFQFVNEDGSTNLQEVRKAFCPENLQWLTIHENRSKGGK